MTTTSTVQRRFGRLPAHDLGDDQDALYSMSHIEPLRLPPVPDYRYWANVYPASDQGATSTCVAHALKHWMQVAPTTQTSPTRPPNPYDLYRKLVLIDEWTANDHEAGAGVGMNFGTSVRAAFKWAKANGYVDEYRWAYDPEDLSNWILTRGPVVAGIAWFQGMMNPDTKGFIYPQGAYLNGHAILLNGHNKVRDDYTLLNSWGPSWGNKGRARIKGKDLYPLIFSNGGEAVAGTEKLIPRG